MPADEKAALALWLKGAKSDEPWEMYDLGELYTYGKQSRTTPAKRLAGIASPRRRETARR
jgi:hypothetical protein